MNLFYTPTIVGKNHTLDKEQSRHAVSVLRLGVGGEILLTDGGGTLCTARVTDPDPKACRVEVISVEREHGRREYTLTMAVAPTKNIDRYEWFLEKATEVGCDVFVPLLCARSERKVIKPDREVKVITSAVQQSLKAYHPVLDQLTPFRELVSRPFAGVKLIAHCDKPVAGRKYIGELLGKDEDAMILIGPEGDFSPEEINFAVENGFREITLGQSRLRTETAAIVAAVTVSLINR